MNSEPCFISELLYFNSPQYDLRDEGRGRKSRIREGMIVRLIAYVDSLWRANRDKYPRLNSKSLVLIQEELREGTYQFSAMYRTLIPKPKKAGSFRPITAPAQRDRLVLDAMTSLLTEVMEPIFLEVSHGFRRGRGAQTFFRAVSGWPEMECVIKCDVRNCFDSIVHGRLLRMLFAHLGRENLPLLVNIARFLKADIWDNEGVNYAGVKVGIPQGSSVSPVGKRSCLLPKCIKSSSAAVIVEWLELPSPMDHFLCNIPHAYRAGNHRRKAS